MCGVFIIDAGVDLHIATASNEPSLMNYADISWALFFLSIMKTGGV